MSATASSGLAKLRARTSAAFRDRLPEHLERLRWDGAELRAHQTRELRSLLADAAARSPFHARRLAGIDPGGFTLEDLPSLPVMTKDDMMSFFAEVVTDRRLDRRRVEEHLDASRCEPAALLGEYVCLASGGSSGVRGVFVQTVAEYMEFGCSIVRPGMARLIAAGGAPPGGLMMAMVAAPSPVHSTAFGAATVTEGPVRFVSVPATLPLPEIVGRLNDLRPPALMGYASTLARLAGERRAGRLSIAPGLVSSTSEMLSREDRAAIEATFGVPVVDQFAATEGLVGHSEPGGSTLTFASDMCIVEIEPDRVLVTNLYNRTQPLIRYELSDRLVRHPDASGWLRADVDGRSDESFRYGDVVVHPLAVRGAMVRTPAVREYQVRQTPRGIDVAVVLGGALDEGALRSALAAGLEHAGVADPEVTVRTVESIRRHPETGKVTRFVGARGSG